MSEDPPLVNQKPTMAPFNGEPSLSEQITLALAPKFASALSIVGSVYIVYDILRRRRRKPSSFQTYQRLLLGLSVCDLLMSSGLFSSTWPMPRGTEYVWGAIGTTESCTFVGFIEQSGVAGIMYNGSLSIYYLLRIRYGWAASKIEREAERWLHLVPILFGISTMIAGLPLKLYNSGIFDCWIAPFPQDCKQSWQSGDGATTCERGDNASLFQFGFDLIPKWLSILLVTVNMVIIYFHVARQEKKSHAKSFNAMDGKKPSLARKLAVQSYLFVGAMYITYTPVIITRIMEIVRGHAYYEMLLTISITIPMQGLWNALVYLRPRWLKARNESNSFFMTAVRVFQRKNAEDDPEEPEEETNPNAVSSDNRTADKTHDEGNSWLPSRRVDRFRDESGRSSTV